MDKPYLLLFAKFPSHPLLYTRERKKQPENAGKLLNFYGIVSTSDRIIPDQKYDQTDFTKNERRKWEKKFG